VIVRQVSIDHKADCPGWQNKKRKFDRDRGRDEQDGEDSKADKEPADPLKDATTLYVGNLYVLEDL
jgi:hypothetical protein